MSEEAHHGFLREALFNGNGVAKKLILALVLFSALITAFITAADLYSHYRRDLREIDRAIEFIGSGYRPTLTDSVWVSDRGQIQTQLDGLLRLPDIEYLAIVVDGRTAWSAGRERSRRVVAREVSLVREHRGQALTIGTLRIVASVDAVLARLWDQLVAVVVRNAVKTLLVAGFMLLVFQYLVTRHLTRVAEFVRAIDPARPRGEQVQLDRPATGRWRPDILDALTGSVNGLSRSLKAGQDELVRSEERLRVLTRETAAFIYEIDHAGRILFANRTYAGLTRTQVESTALVEWFPAKLRPRVEQALAAVFAEARPQSLEYTIPDPAGHPRAYMAMMAPIVDAGRVSSVAFTAVDISDQKAAELAIRDLNRGLEAKVRERTAELERALERAESASRAKSELLSRMSHELRTPMNAILGFAQILELSDPTPAQRKWAGEIRRAGEHLLQMIEDLLDLARIEVGKLAVHLQPLRVAAVVEESVALIRPLAAARGLTLTVTEFCDPQAQVRSDAVRLRQVLVNLLSNAVKYSREHGSIVVQCEARAAALRISVADAGPGLAPEKLARLFRPFERLGAEQGGVEGSGIGLALCKQLADLMGATIGVESAVGVGSTFWIDLPRLDPQPPGAGAPVAAAPAVDAPAYDVLYVEDNPSNQALVESFLAPIGRVRLRVAGTGSDGLASARAQPPHVVLLDVHLPDMDGFAVLRELRADRRLQAVPVIALSADAMPHDVQRGLAAGFDHYVTKPFDLRLLLATMDALVSGGTSAAHIGQRGLV